MMIYLGCMDLDLALRIDEPAPITEESSKAQRVQYEKWERSNRLGLMILQQGIPEHVRGAISTDAKGAKSYLAELEKVYVKNDKAEIGTLLAKLTSIRYASNGSVREHILSMSQIAMRLKVLDLALPDDLLVHLVLNSLPPQYGQIRTSYNCQPHKWTLNELIAHCVDEEEKMMAGKKESAHMVTSVGKGKKRKMTADKGKAQKKPNVIACFFCNKAGHFKKNCTKYAAWRAKKGLPELPKAN